MQRAWFNLMVVAAMSAGAFIVPGAALAQDGLVVDVTPSVVCDTATFSLAVSGGSGQHDLAFDFGDGDVGMQLGVSTYPVEVEHAYPDSGSYGWSVLAVDAADAALQGMAAGSLGIGPSITLLSDPFPPLLTLSDGSAELSFSAEVVGGSPPYTFGWDLDGDGNLDDGADSSASTASFTYQAAGKYQASVMVVDNCGLTASDSLAVVVFDPEDACHPRAQQIAEAVSSLFPDQAEQLYSCEDIFNYFQGGLTGSQLGFGRMWHAYQLALTIDELTWEEILDWHLEGSGWGKLTQLDRFADALAEVGIRQLVEMVMSGEASINDLRTAVRAVTRYEADFEDALARAADGASPGQLGQFYKMAQELGVEPETLDAYLADGLKLSDLRHAAGLADRYGSDLESITAARASGASWGQIGQAFKLADEEISAQEVLEIGVNTYRQEQRDEERAAREIERLAGQYGLTTDEVQAINEACGGDKQCVRDQLRSQDRQAEQIAQKYGVSLEQVWSVYDGACSQDWNCVRTHFRDLTRGEHGGGNGGGNGGGKKSD